MAGLIYCGDNLDVLGEYIPRESVDLIYLDPPFNSQRTYNLIYKDQRAQEEAFKDYWSWNEAAPKFHLIVDSSEIPKPIRTLLSALHEVLIDNDSDQLAYLTMMTPRLVALHRALKPTGSLYLHCDPTASHYLKTILDALFGLDRFANEIIWQRTNARTATDRWPRVHDVLLFYSKDEKRTFHPLKVLAEMKKLPHTLITGPDGKKYQTYELTAPNLRFGETGKSWRGFQPADMGRCWGNPPSVMDEWDRQGLIHWPKKGKKRGAGKKSEKPWPRRRDAHPFEPENRSVTIGDVWTDVDRINQTAKERLGYPTQKPLALLERILRASSKEGDLVLDPFCGCGTTVEAAESLGRRWIGIDITRKAVEVIEERFKNGKLEAPEITWHPADPKSAEALAERDKHQFEEWVLRKVRAARIRKKDRGIDGEALFKEPDGSKWHVLVSVKGGKHLAPTFVRDLRGTMEREGAAIGVLVSMFEPSKEMKLEAARAGFLSESDAEGPIPRLQLVTVDRLFSDQPAIRTPGVNVTQMPKPSVPPPPGANEQLSLGLDRRVSDAKVKRLGVVNAKVPAKKNPVKAYPAPVQPDLAVAESVPPSRKR